MKKMLKASLVLLIICNGSFAFALTQQEQMLQQQDAGFAPVTTQPQGSSQPALTQQQQMLQQQEAGFGPTSGAATGDSSGGATGPLASAKLQNPIKYDNFSDFVAAVLKVAVEILMPFVVLAFIWAGFLFVRAQGNEKQLEEAKAAIKWSIVGAFILMGAWGFAQIIGTTVSTLTQ